jgi:hypothetical protein
MGHYVLRNVPPQVKHLNKFLTPLGLQLNNPNSTSKKSDKNFKVYALASRLLELGSVLAFLINYYSSDEGSTTISKTSSNI